MPQSKKEYGEEEEEKKSDDYEDESVEDIEVRNITYKKETNVTKQNYCMIFEDHPLVGASYVEQESIRVIVASILDGQDPQTLSVEFPQILYDIRDDPDNNFTVVVGTTC